MAGKELDSNFLIFLPHVFTNDPVSDIELGSRNSCYAGERLCFFLIAQFRGKNRTDENFQAWQKRLLRVSTSVSVSSIDLMVRKDDTHAGGLVTCWPISSSKVEGKEPDLRKKVEPKITTRGDIIYPLNVLLDSLPALTRRMRLSVNVWTPELNVSGETEAFHSNDFKQYLVDHDPEDLIEESKNAWRCIVNATLPVVTPPTLCCKYFQVAGKHFLCIEVINILGKSVNLNEVDVHTSSDVAAENEKNMIHNQGHMRQESKPRFSCLDVFPVTASENLSSKHPILLRPWEHYAFLFRIIYHENQMAFNKQLEVALKGSITWGVETLKERYQTINTTYSLPVFVVRRSSVSVRASCQSSVRKGKRFQVKYTVTNTDQDDGNVSLIWSPVNDDSIRTQDVSATEQSVVCLQPKVRIGCCPSGSSVTVNVEFLAVQEGLHEVGKFMKCKWHGESDERDFSGSPSQRQDVTSGFTTVSHSCQVFVTGVR
ncbi:trafficking protein particle complex subunit 14-like isoform X2 [Oculina patagonica]